MEQNKSSIGTLIAAILIIAIVVLGGLYFWGKRIEETRNTASLTGEEAGSEPQSEAAVIRSTSNSDELSSIEQDLQNTNTTNLDAELQAR